MKSEAYTHTSTRPSTSLPSSEGDSDLNISPTAVAEGRRLLTEPKDHHEFETRRLHVS